MKCAFIDAESNGQLSGGRGTDLFEQIGDSKSGRDVQTLMNE